MKIFKVNLDPSNPVEKIVKVPVGSDYGIQINWDYEKFPTFTNSDVDTENGKLTYTDGVIKENTSFTDVNGQKIFTNLPVIENVGNTIIFAYGKDETFDENKLDNFGSIKVVGIDTDDYDVDVSGGTTYTSITEEGDSTLIQNDCVTICIGKNFNVYGKDSTINFGTTANPIRVYINGTYIYDIGGGCGTSYTSITETDCTTTIDNDCVNIHANTDGLVLYGNQLVCISSNSKLCMHALNIIELDSPRININSASLLINGQQYQPGTSYESITEEGDATLIQNDCIYINARTQELKLYGEHIRIVSDTELVLGAKETLYINDTQICLTKFLADYGM